VYGAKVDQLKAEIGAVAGTAEIERALQAKRYKLVTVTHVDTSTGVLSDARGIAETVRRVSPDTLVSLSLSLSLPLPLRLCGVRHRGHGLTRGSQVVLDGVCSVASEEIRFDDWGIDVVLAASQKGLGVPPGLSVLCASERAIKARIPCAFLLAAWRLTGARFLGLGEPQSAAYVVLRQLEKVRIYVSSRS
jgi:alanine-glyoxylate transaminase / serine-glyoxylate transaminase / serine-pyruvate transaminase